jgi:hypothetical protein
MTVAHRAMEELDSEIGARRTMVVASDQRKTHMGIELNYDLC